MKMYRVEIVDKKSGERLHTFTGHRDLAEIERECLKTVLMFVGAPDCYVDIVEANNGK